MDTVIKKKFWSAPKVLVAMGSIALMGVLATTLFVNHAQLNVKREHVTVDAVKQGIFQELIPLRGTIMSAHTIYLDAAEGGRVESLFVEDGAIVKKGDPLIKLLNTDLELSLANQETEVRRLLTDMQQSRNSSEQNTLNRRFTLAEVDQSLKDATREYEINKKLSEDRVISINEFRKISDNYQYQLRRKRLAEQALRNDTTTNVRQLAEMRESLERSRIALELMKRKASDLTVRSPVDGQVINLEAQVGESKNKGQRLGQIDVVNGFKVRVDIDEHYITRVVPGLKASFAESGAAYNLILSKVYTQVTAGRFQADFKFVSKPANFKIGQTLAVSLALGDPSPALLLAKGAFYQQTGGNWIFKLSADGKHAFRFPVQLGRQNIDFYEVMRGLKAGDRVIVSSYEGWERINEINLTE